MAIERIFFNVSGAIDGANSTYVLPVDYVVGTVKPFINGQLVADQLFVEIQPRTVALEFAPIEGDSVCFYCEVS